MKQKELWTIIGISALTSVIVFILMGAIFDQSDIISFVTNEPKTTGRAVDNIAENNIVFGENKEKSFSRTGVKNGNYVVRRYKDAYSWEILASSSLQSEALHFNNIEEKTNSIMTPSFIRIVAPNQEDEIKVGPSITLTANGLLVDSYNENQGNYGAEALEFGTSTKRVSLNTRSGLNIENDGSIVNIGPDEIFLTAWARGDNAFVCVGPTGTLYRSNSACT